ncbi:5-formyltetrahydrofolate cyclo-ligase, partial [Acinetobacter baumannii]
QLPQAARDAAAQGVSDQLDALVASVGAHSVSCFISTPTEPGTRDFLTAAVRRGIRVLLPVTRVDGLLDWAVATDDENVAEGLFGLP